MILFYFNLDSWNIINLRFKDLLKCKRETPLKHDKMQARMSSLAAIRMMLTISISMPSTSMKILILSMKIGDIAHSTLYPQFTKMRKKLTMVKNMRSLLEFYMKQFQEKIFVWLEAFLSLEIGKMWSVTLYGQLVTTGYFLSHLLCNLQFSNINIWCMTRANHWAPLMVFGSKVLIELLTWEFFQKFLKLVRLISTANL